MIEGEAVIGKTAVWHSAINEAMLEGCRVFGCVADQAEVATASLLDQVTSKAPPPTLSAPQNVRRLVSFLYPQGFLDPYFHGRCQDGGPRWDAARIWCCGA